jgi:hypothetical protein
VEIKIRDADPALFADAVKHLQGLGASALSVFADRRPGEGPWLVAFVIVAGRRHVRWTGDDWRDRDRNEQAKTLAAELEAFVPLPPGEHGV